MTSNDARELSGSTLLVGVCGGIAAYKCAGIVSTLRQAGADVHVIMTDAATKFVTPLTFQAISNNDVHTDMFAQGSTWDIAHIGLVRKSDLMLVLNATANTLAKLAHGIADDLLTTCVLATRKPVVIAPAMNTAMLEAAPTQANIAALQARGFEFVEPGSGFLACGEVGSGRLAGDDDIIHAVRRVLHRTHQLSSERVLITAGPTREFAEWVLRRGVRWIAVDAGSADHPMNTVIRRLRADEAEEAEKKLGSLDALFPKGDYQIMHTLLFPHDVVHIENLGGQVDEVLDRKVLFGCYPWRFQGGEAALCRAVAMVE